MYKMYFFLSFDRLGRLRTFICVEFLAVIWWTLAIATPWYSLYVAARFLTGACAMGAYMIGFVYSKSIYINGSFSFMPIFNG